MNPCPCGWLGAPAAIGRACRCTPEAVARYQGRLSGPLLDRIDLQVEVLAAPAAALLALPDGEPSAVVAARVAAARQRQLRRQGEPNAMLEAGRIDEHCRPDDAARALPAQRRRAPGLERPPAAPLPEGGAHHRRPGRQRTIATAHVAEALQLQRVLAD